MLLSEIIKYKDQQDYWNHRFENITKKDDAILRGSFDELEKEGIIKISCASGIPYFIEILKDGYLYNKHMREGNKMKRFEKQLNEILERSETFTNSFWNFTNFFWSVFFDRKVDKEFEAWIYDCEIFYKKYLKEHLLGSRMELLLQHPFENR